MRKTGMNTKYTFSGKNSVAENKNASQKQNSIWNITAVINKGAFQWRPEMKEHRSCELSQVVGDSIR